MAASRVVMSALDRRKAADPAERRAADEYMQRLLMAVLNAAEADAATAARIADEKAAREHAVADGTTPAAATPLVPVGAAGSALVASTRKEHCALLPACLTAESCVCDPPPPPLPAGPELRDGLHRFGWDAVLGKSHPDRWMVVFKQFYEKYNRSSLVRMP